MGLGNLGLDEDTANGFAKEGMDGAELTRLGITHKAGLLTHEHREQAAVDRRAGLEIAKVGIGHEHHVNTFGSMARARAEFSRAAICSLSTASLCLSCRTFTTRLPGWIWQDHRPPWHQPIV
jgi:hypothetical protein